MSSIWQVRRSASDAKLAGVCGGVAAHWHVDPVLVRVGWMLLALTGGVGVVLYAAAWLLVPLEGRPTSVLDDSLGGLGSRWPRSVWVGLVVLACVLSLAALGGISPFGLGPAVVLAVVWYFGFYGNRARRLRRDAAPPALGTLEAPSPPAGPSTPFTEAAAAWQARVAQVREQHGAPGEPVAPAARPAPAPAPAAAPAFVPPPATAPAWSAPASAPAVEPPADPDPRAAFLAAPDPVGLYVDPPAAVPVRPGRTPAARRLRLATLLALGLALGGLGLVDRSGAALSPAVYAATALLVVGLALVVATWLGRARGLLALGLVLAVVAVATATGVQDRTTGPFRSPDGYGNRELVYASTAAFPVEPDHLGLGSLEVDLTGVRLDADTAYAARVDDGQLVVAVPRGTGVRLRYAAGWGEVEALGREVASGQRLGGTADVAPAAAGQHTLTLDLAVEHGRVEVRR